MFPIATSTLSFREISDYWSRDIQPRASSDELLSILVSAWWLGELRGDSGHSRLQLLKIMFTSMCKDHLGIVFIVGDDPGPPRVELPDGYLKIDLRPQIRVPSSNVESWDEAACKDAFHALAEITEQSLIESYQEFAVFARCCGFGQASGRSRAENGPRAAHIPAIRPDAGDQGLRGGWCGY